MDTCSTKNSGVFYVDFFMCIIGVDLRGYQVKFEPYFFKCNPRCISHVICFTWINGVPVHVDIRWISCEKFHLILFHLLSMLQTEQTPVTLLKWRRKVLLLAISTPHGM